MKELYVLEVYYSDTEHFVLAVTDDPKEKAFEIIKDFFGEYKEYHTVKTEEPNIVWEISIEYIASNGAKEQASIICSNFKLNKL